MLAEQGAARERATELARERDAARVEGESQRRRHDDATAELARARGALAVARDEARRAREALAAREGVVADLRAIAGADREALVEYRSAVEQLERRIEALCLERQQEQHEHQRQQQQCQQRRRQQQQQQALTSAAAMTETEGVTAPLDFAAPLLDGGGGPPLPAPLIDRPNGGSRRDDDDEDDDDEDDDDDRSFESWALDDCDALSQVLARPPPAAASPPSASSASELISSPPEPSAAPTLAGHDGSGFERRAPDESPSALAGSLGTGAAGARYRADDLLTAAAAKRAFALTDADLKRLAPVGGTGAAAVVVGARKGCHYYRPAAARELALDKHGTPKGIEDALGKREAKRADAKRKRERAEAHARAAAQPGQSLLGLTARDSGGAPRSEEQQQQQQQQPTKRQHHEPQVDQRIGAHGDAAAPIPIVERPAPSLDFPPTGARTSPIDESSEGPTRPFMG